MSVQIKPIISSEAPSQRTIDEINKATSLRHTEEMPGINSSIYYVGRAFTFIRYHVEDEGTSSISFLCLGEAKVWYVANSAMQTSIEPVIATALLEKKYLNDHNGGTR